MPTGSTTEPAKRSRRAVRVVCVAALILVGVAPFAWLLLGGHSADGLDEARARWAESGYESYRLTFRRSGGLSLPWNVTVEVVDGEIASVDVGEYAPHPDPMTIEDIFDYVEESAELADDCDIEWDAELGYPTSAGFWLDNAMDGHWGISVVSLVPLAGGT